ncbi:MAG: lipo-like protein [Deltaproteobacteria bacterium]|nr:lipo-like protein [Deltaproteobacteria bacterium]
MDRALYLLQRRVVDIMADLLTKPRRVYEQRIPNDLAALKSQLKPGDVILVEGDQRISQVIRYLTQSSWSHAAIYIGDELRRFNVQVADALLEQHTTEARHLIIEATAEEGVVCAPVTKYINHNIRICRPRNLRRDDLERMLRELVAQLGWAYNTRHIVELGRYFFPVTLIPARFRRTALRHGGDATRQVICTTMLARAFGNIGFPIIPRVKLDEIDAQHTWVGRLLGRNGSRQRALYEPEDPTVITPRDFDLSPYFDVVKFNHLANGRFDYRRIEWVTQAAATPAPPTANDEREARESDQGRVEPSAA